MIIPQRLINTYSELLWAYNNIGSTIRRDLEVLKYKVKRGELTQTQFEKVKKWLKVEYKRDICNGQELLIRIIVSKKKKPSRKRKKRENYGETKPREDTEIKSQGSTEAAVAVVERAIFCDKTARWKMRSLRKAAITRTWQ